MSAVQTALPLKLPQSGPVKTTGQRQSFKKMLVELRQEAAYKAIRKTLSIDYHWVCQLFEGFLGDSDSVVVEGMGNFIAAGKPECWVFDMLAAG